MKTLYKLLIRPFERHLGLLFLFFILSTTTSVLLHIFVYPAYLYSIYIILHSFFISYITTLILTFLPHIIKNIASYIISLLLSIFFVIDFYCILILKTPFDADFATLITATNVNEANEFMSSMVSWSFIITTFTILLIIGILYYFIKRLNINKRWYNILFAFVVLSIIAFIRNPMVIENCIDGRITNIITYDIPNNLKEHFVNPPLTSTNESPQNIVVIMGESFSKHHSSLYGYEKCTNPQLHKLIKDSSLLVFKNVTSAGLTTMGSFKYMMSDYNPNNKNSSKKWYEYYLLHDILEQANYYTYWISNHSNAGISNNVTRLLAEASNEYVFCKNHLGGDFKISYDEELINITKPILQHSEKHPYKFFLFHLMGSHFKFDLRYPPHFTKFSDIDYIDKPINQRATLAAYDNSILYNDSVVYEIIQLFKNKESIILYLSDHGLDVYNSSDNYAAHGIHSNPISAKYGAEIPFLIYMTEQYRSKYPIMVNNLKQKTEQPFRTDSLMQFIMEIIGIEINENN